MPMDVKDALGLMFQFGTFVVTLIGIVITIILAIVQKKK
jgi:hypothetical protein